MPRASIDRLLFGGVVNDRHSARLAVRSQKRASRASWSPTDPQARQAEYLGVSDDSGFFKQRTLVLRQT
jgi:hypothetical protein